jgi:ABC-type branched-subunit amino acid transport system substrate-binding protein
MSIGVTLRRGWRRFREQPGWLQGVAAVLVLAIVAAGVGLALSLGGESSDGSDAGPTAETGGPPESAVASTDGVTDDSITVVFPVIDVAAAGRAVGLEGGSEEDDAEGVATYVDEINDAGGINGRVIDARIEEFNPLEPESMRALCKDWTESGDVFAVVDTGKWYDAQQLCITQEGDMPLISNWTTVSDWTARGAPYLWWTGPDQSEVLENLVNYGVEDGSLGPDIPFAIVAGDRAGDQLAVEEYLVPALERQGLEPVAVETISASIEDPSTSRSQAAVAVERLQSEGVETVIPLLPVNAFFPYLSAAAAQDYAPRLLLSDYENSIQVALGLAEFQFPDLLSGQAGPTVYTLSDEDDPRDDVGYSDGAQSCFDTWEESHDVPPTLEAQGPIMRWCEAIRLFATAAEKAGPDLDRRKFVVAMSELKGVQGALVPELTYGRNRFAGPTEYRVVRVFKNGDTMETNGCPLKTDGTLHGSCWQLVEDFQPLQLG